MEKSIIFADVDNTLRTPGKPMEDRVKHCIREFISLGHHFVYCTAQPCSYMCGATTEWQTPGAWILGSTGAVLYKGITMPPKDGCKIIPFAPEELEQFQQFMIVFRMQLEIAGLEEIFWSPNGEASEFVVTPFWNEDMFLKEKIMSIFSKCWDFMPHNHLCFFENRDALDIMISSVNKAHGMFWVANMLEIPISNCYALGDSDNDLPILSVVKKYRHDYVVGNHKFKDNYEPSYRFASENYAEMLMSLLKNLR